MSINIYGKIIIVIFFLMLVPDFILSLGGRDTYLFHRYPILVNVGIIVTIITVAMIFVELIILFKNNKIMAISFFVSLILLYFFSKLLIGILIDRSVLEAHIEVEAFFRNKGFVENTIVKIEDEVVPFYEKFLTIDFSKKDILLQWKSPQYGQYEFKVLPLSTRSFFVRLSTRQNRPNIIWVHK